MGTALDSHMYIYVYILYSYTLGTGNSEKSTDFFEGGTQFVALRLHLSPLKRPADVDLGSV